MEYVQLCNPTNSECRRFSRLVMGTDHLAQAGWVSASQPEPSIGHVHAVLDEAARWGINLFDTAPIYVGGVEFKFGKWRTERQTKVLQDDFYVDPSLNPDRTLYALSKGGFPFDLWSLKSLPAGCHSIELIDELKKRGILSASAQDWQTVTHPVPSVPPGTYASHL